MEKISRIILCMYHDEKLPHWGFIMFPSNPTELYTLLPPNPPSTSLHTALPSLFHVFSENLHYFPPKKKILSQAQQVSCKTYCPRVTSFRRWFLQPRPPTNLQLSVWLFVAPRPLCLRDPVDRRRRCIRTENVKNEELQENDQSRKKKKDKRSKSRNARARIAAWVQRVGRSTMHTKYQIPRFTGQITRGN